MKQNLPFLLFLFIGFHLFGFQDSPKDSLANKTFKQLNALLIRSMNDSIKSRIYAETIVSKGKEKKDTVQILGGFYFLSIIHKGSNDIFRYSDSVIRIGKKVKNDRLIGMSFLNKGKRLFTDRKFNLALDNFLSAKTYIKEYPRLNFLNEHNIGLLKSRIGDHQEANEIFRNSWEIINNDSLNRDKSNYLSSLFSLADSYNRIKKYDSATYFNRLGTEKSKLFDNKKRYYQFVLNEGINQYHLENYTASYDSVFKVLKEYKDDLDIPNLIFAYNYCGKNLIKQHKDSLAIECFKKVDSLFVLSNDIHPETRDTYEYLISYYKSVEDLPNQLRYVTQLLKVDSTLNINNQYLSKRIAKLYDTPKLLEEKEGIIDSLENKNNLISSRLYVAVILLILALTGLFYFYYRQRVLKRRFMNLMNSDHKTVESVSQPILKESKIPEDVVSHILDELDLFEKEKGFLDGKITLNDLSKKFNTNSKYLSKVINTHKNKNFSVYVNDLRVEHVVEKIKKDRKFRNYTIKAISSEVGFNTTQAFSKAFHKKTGIYPSYFIRSVEKLNSENQ